MQLLSDVLSRVAGLLTCRGNRFKSCVHSGECLCVSQGAVSKETPAIKGSKQLSVLIIVGGAMRPKPSLLRPGMYPGM